MKCALSTTDPVPGLITTATFIATHLDSIICLAFTYSLLVYNVIYYLFVHLTKSFCTFLFTYFASYYLCVNKEIQRIYAHGQQHILCCRLYCKKFEKRVKCQECSNVLGSNEEIFIPTAVDVPEDCDHFLNSINRGCFIKPSDVIFLSCIASWRAYKLLWTIMTAGLTSCHSNPRDLFL